MVDTSDGSQKPTFGGPMAACSVLGSKGCTFPALANGFCQACQWKVKTKEVLHSRQDENHVVNAMRAGGDTQLKIGAWLEKTLGVKIRVTVIEDILDSLVERGDAVLKEPNGSFDRWKLTEKAIAKPVPVDRPEQVRDRSSKPAWARVATHIHVMGPRSRKQLHEALKIPSTEIYAAVRDNSAIFHVDPRGLVMVTGPAQIPDLEVAETEVAETEAWEELKEYPNIQCLTQGKFIEAPTPVEVDVYMDRSADRTGEPLTPERGFGVLTFSPLDITAEQLILQEAKRITDEALGAAWEAEGRTVKLSEDTGCHFAWPAMFKAITPLLRRLRDLETRR